MHSVQLHCVNLHVSAIPSFSLYTKSTMCTTTTAGPLSLLQVYISNCFHFLLICLLIVLSLIHKHEHILSVLSCSDLWGQPQCNGQSILSLL